MATVNDLLTALTLCAALGCGLIAGVFFAFSAFLMKAFARLPPGEGMATMQSINVVVINPLFLGVFLGTGVACALAIMFALLRWHAPGSVFLLAGSLLYLVGCFLVTMVCNVPMNEALASAAPADAGSASRWSSYLANWTRWNHVRTAASLAAAALLIIALCYRASQR